MLKTKCSNYGLVKLIHHHAYSSGGTLTFAIYILWLPEIDSMGSFGLLHPVNLLCVLSVLH